MFLLYLDESGNENEPADRYFVLAGLALFERQPMSAQQFMELLFGKLPEIFQNEAELRALFDVLAHEAYALPPLAREERAARAKLVITTHFNTKQQIFLDFVLSHYVRVGVEELDQEKLTPLLRLAYHDSIADAVADLGRPDEIGRVFAGFQKYLYQQQAAA